MDKRGNLPSPGNCAPPQQTRLPHNGQTPSSTPQGKVKLPDIFTTCHDLTHFTSYLGPNGTYIKPNIVQRVGFDVSAKILDPKILHFVPIKEWSDEKYSLESMKQLYFTRRNGNGRRFDVKLYNALKITEAFPSAYSVVGVRWITDSIIKVDSKIFAMLLGITAVQGGLFHKQGNFPRHGFIPIQSRGDPELEKNPYVQDVDNYSIRLYRHSSGLYTRSKSEGYLEGILAE